MRIKVASNRVYEGNPEQVLRVLHQTSAALKAEPFRQYLEGLVRRLRPVKVWLDPPAHLVRGSDDDFARWLGAELLRVGRWSETDAPTEEEKEAKAAAAAAAKAAAAKAAPSAAPPAAASAAAPGKSATPSP